MILDHSTREFHFSFRNATVWNITLLTFLEQPNDLTLGFSTMNRTLSVYFCSLGIVNKSSCLNDQWGYIYYGILLQKTSFYFRLSSVLLRRKVSFSWNQLLFPVRLAECKTQVITFIVEMTLWIVLSGEKCCLNFWKSASVCHSICMW